MVFSEGFNHDYDLVQPDPALILESLRSIGYSLEMAIADIIDNSISAGAKNIHFDTNASGEYIMISDDGEGLSEIELLNSLRMGSLDPRIERKHGDLGRFGLGLKIASLSHCTKLTVASKIEGGTISIRQWDLEYIRQSKEWRLKQPDINDYPVIEKALEPKAHGTVVYWENIDRFIKKSGSTLTAEDRTWYGKQILKVNDHLQMVFHRFLEDGDFTLTLQGNMAAIPWDPFLKDLSTPLDAEQHIPGIAVYPYILPHKSKLTQDGYKKASGPLLTWARAQGFYVYRGKRLITAGTWLGLPGFTKSRDTDLARIQLDISNEEDAEWMLDVKKSTVKIPRKYRKDLERIAKSARERARSVKMYRGKISRREHPGDYKFLWDMNKNRAGEVRYVINKFHPLINELLNGENPVSKEEIKAILHLIEETVPTQGIILQDMVNPDSVPEPFNETKPDDLLRIMQTALEIVDIKDMSMEEKKAKLLLMEPFSEHPELIDHFFKEEV